MHTCTMCKKRVIGRTNGLCPACSAWVTEACRRVPKPFFRQSAVKMKGILSELQRATRRRLVISIPVDARDQIIYGAFVDSTLFDQMTPEEIEGMNALIFIFGFEYVIRLLTGLERKRLHERVETIASVRQRTPS